MKFRDMAACALLALLASCATPYQRVGALGGFDEVRLSADTYRVSVQGNGYTTPERAYQIMLLRAAQLTLENGYSRFALIDEEAENDSQLVYTGLYTGYSTISRPRGTLTIRMLMPDADVAEAIDAATIKAELEPRLLQKKG